MLSHKTKVWAPGGFLYIWPVSGYSPAFSLHVQERKYSQLKQLFATLPSQLSRDLSLLHCCGRSGLGWLSSSWGLAGLFLSQVVYLQRMGTKSSFPE